MLNTDIKIGADIQTGQVGKILKYTQSFKQLDAASVGCKPQEK